MPEPAGGLGAASSLGFMVWVGAEGSEIRISTVILGARACKEMEVIGG